MNVMTWIRVLFGAIWLNAAAEKILNPQFPAQFPWMGSSPAHANPAGGKEVTHPRIIRQPDGSYAVEEGRARLRVQARGRR